jgi:hypothetical protein
VRAFDRDLVRWRNGGGKGTSIVSLQEKLRVRFCCVRCLADFVAVVTDAVVMELVVVAVDVDSYDGFIAIG